MASTISVSGDSPVATPGERGNCASIKAAVFPKITTCNATCPAFLFMDLNYVPPKTQPIDHPAPAKSNAPMPVHSQPAGASGQFFGQSTKPSPEAGCVARFIMFLEDFFENGWSLVAPTSSTVSLKEREDNFKGFARKINAQRSADKAAEFAHANFSELNLPALLQANGLIDLSNMTLPNGNFEEANLKGVSLSRSVLKGSKLRSANLEGASLVGADLTASTMRRANLNNADLTGANLSGTNLTRATLANATLTGASLRGSDLGNADLQRANLQNADLRGAKLASANFTGAALENAKLDAKYSKTYLPGVNRTIYRFDLVEESGESYVLCRLK